MMAGSTRRPPKLTSKCRCSVVARDFDRIDLPFPERGEPVHVPGGGRPPRHRPAGPETEREIDETPA